MYNLGINYYYGLGCEKNLEKSKEFFKKASDLGYEEGSLLLKIFVNLIRRLATEKMKSLKFVWRSQNFCFQDSY